MTLRRMCFHNINGTWTLRIQYRSESWNAPVTRNRKSHNIWGHDHELMYSMSCGTFGMGLPASNARPAGPGYLKLIFNSTYKQLIPWPTPLKGLTV